ncbi:hypothetical protein RLOC_00000596 [Lonchura striata]|uniref:Uncharacterized protein n=1 Tax=Lonchura striata TaxID=40157 RepID=A0A218VAQ5_9PASE|nr:hypothetical protein RLOC_00000596 [Lonchura striata domestica]
MKISTQRCGKNCLIMVFMKLNSGMGVRVAEKKRKENKGKEKKGRGKSRELVLFMNERGGIPRKPQQRRNFGGNNGCRG